MSDDRADDAADRDEDERPDDDAASTAPARRDRASAQRRASARPAGRSERAAGSSKDRPTQARDGRDTTKSPAARLVRFLREVVAELRKVIWPTRKQLVTYTAVVLVFVTFMVAFVAVADILFARGVFFVFG